MNASDTNTWRLLVCDPDSGARNMALDEAILESVSSGSALPTLRLYAWRPPCLSLGYAQPVGDVDRQALADRGWQLVRRPTGGRAILHTDELTYAVIAPDGHPDLRGGVLESYRRLSRGLTSGLAALGVSVDPVHEAPIPPGSRENPVCFEAPSAYEITVGGLKLLGSAQVRRRGGILQHGTLPLAGDISRICLALRYGDQHAREEARSRVLARAATLGRLLGYDPAWPVVVQAMQSGFEQALGWQFEPGEVLPRESERARELEDERFTDPAWTERI
jgi:lipoate-protein ligase A